MELKPNEWIKIQEITKLVEVLRYFVSHFSFTEKDNYIYIVKKFVVL